MARNEEKAQSMLYRFREAQAAELGLGTRADRRPRMASSCKSLRECERWRGEILREISRKVSKIQDAGLTDYEVRDLNDEINKLMREKRHWENQIVALGGANYRRNVPMLDEDGREVPGTKGYKYFGRAKDLPGVREMFMSKKKDEDEEEKSSSYYRKFANQGPAYYGDLDELAGVLIADEEAAERAAWEEACQHLMEMLGVTSQAIQDILPVPKPLGAASAGSIVTVSDDDAMDAEAEVETGAGTVGSKRKASHEQGGDAVPPTSVKARTEPEPETHPGEPTPAPDWDSLARATTARISFLSPEQLIPPALPSREEMEKVLLEVRKRALVEEYFG